MTTCPAPRRSQRSHRRSLAARASDLQKTRFQRVLAALMFCQRCWWMRSPIFDFQPSRSGQLFPDGALAGARHAHHDQRARYFGVTFGTEIRPAMQP